MNTEYTKMDGEASCYTTRKSFIQFWVSFRSFLVDESVLVIHGHLKAISIGPYLDSDVAFQVFLPLRVWAPLQLQ